MTTEPPSLARHNPVSPNFDADEPIARIPGFVAKDRVTLAIADWYYRRDWRLQEAIASGGDGPGYPFCMIASKWDELTGQFITRRIIWVAGDLPHSAEKLHAAKEYVEHQMGGAPISRARVEIWVTRAEYEKGASGPKERTGRLTADRSSYEKDRAPPKWRPEESVTLEPVAVT